MSTNSSSNAQYPSSFGKDTRIASSVDPRSRKAIVRLVTELRGRGVKLRADGDRLHCEIPKGALSKDELETLRLAKGEIITLLRQATRTQTPTRRETTGPVPLTLLQLLHWKTIQSKERLCQRATAAAVNIRGRMNIDKLQQSVDQLTHRHEVLRARIGLIDGQPRQWIVESPSIPLGIQDLTSVSDDELDSELRRRIAEIIRAPINPAIDPLFTIHLLKLRDDEHVLLIAMEHIISDGSSLSLLWRDLFDNYANGPSTQPAAGPTIEVQFLDYAAWQAQAYRAWTRKHGQRWGSQLKDARLAAFPEDRTVQPSAVARWGRSSIDIDTALKDEWQDWCRKNGTTLPMSALAVYAALVLRWCNTSAAVLQYQTSGRLNQKIENTVGLFATPVCLPISIAEGNTLVDLLKKVTAEYCQCYSTPDFCYMGAQVPRLEWSRGPSLNWIPRGRPLQVTTAAEEDALAIGPVEFENPVFESFALNADPSIIFVETDDAISGSVHFPMHLFSMQTMERFSLLFTTFLRALLRDGRTPVQQLSL